MMNFTAVEKRDIAGARLRWDSRENEVVQYRDDSCHARPPMTESFRGVIARTLRAQANASSETERS